MHSDSRGPVWVKGCGGSLQGCPFPHGFCAQTAWEERTTSAGRTPLAVMALPQALHSSWWKRCCWHLYGTFRAFFASLFISYLEKKLDSYPEMVHKSLKCIHLACLRGCSIALRAECDKCYGPHHHHLILYVTEKKIWPGMVVSGRTRYLRYCLLISVMKPPLREETDHEPDFNHLFLLVPIFLLSEPESTDQKTLIPSLDGKQRKGIQNSLMPCHAWHADSAAPQAPSAPDEQLHISETATLHLCPLTKEMNILKCKHQQQPPWLLHRAWQAAKCHFGSPFGLYQTGGTKSMIRHQRSAYHA